MRILLAVDGSNQSIDAAGLLAKLPFAEAPDVTVLSVLVDATFDIVNSDAGVQLREVEQETAKKNFDNVQAILRGAGMTATHEIVEGHPNRHIIESAKKIDADLIVLGARGHSTVARVLLGSTSDFVANHAECPVLIVRPHAADKKSSGLRVVLAYDGSPAAREAAAEAFRLKWDANTELQIVTMLERPTLIPDDVVYDETAIAEADDAMKLLAAQNECAAKIKYSVREVLDVGNALAGLVNEEHADLIIMGDTGKSAIARLFLGSASRHVLHHAHCSVWIAREKNW